MNLSHPGHMPLKPGQEVQTTGEILGYAAKTFPDKTGLICAERQWSFTEFDNLANQFAHAVRSTLTDKDKRVGIMSRNCAEYLITHFGTGRTERVCVHFSPRYTIDDLIYAADLTNPGILVVDNNGVGIVAEALNKMQTPPLVVCIDDCEIPDVISFWEFIAGQSTDAPDISIDPESPASIIFTGGTTGKPKAGLVTHLARAVSAMAGVEDFRVCEDDIAGFAVPFCHTAGMYSWCQPAILAGCTGVVIPKWDVPLFSKLTKEHGITVTFAVPTQLALLLDHPQFDPNLLESLRMIAFGGAPLSRELIEHAENLMPWLTCARAYGSTECGHMAAQIKNDRQNVYDGFNQPGGRLIIEIFKEPGVVAEEGEIGEVATRGPHVMLEYLGNKNATTGFFKSAETEGDWAWMGDLARKHNGYFSLVGRSKDMILSGGMNIFPAELEEVLMNHPSISGCAVFGINDSTWGEIPAAAVILNNPSASDDELMDYVAGHVADYKQIRRIFFVDKIPVTGAGKTKLHLLKEQLGL